VGNTQLGYAFAAVDQGRSITSMPALIVGHTTGTSARVWLHGDKKNSHCAVALWRVEASPPNNPGATGKPAGSSPECLSSRSLSIEDYSGTLDFTDLCRDAEYRVEATFLPSGKRVLGRIRRGRQPDASGAFSFVLSSCNLSIVSINDFLAFMAASAGTSFALSSLELPFFRWRWPRLVALRRLAQKPLSLLLQLSAYVIHKATALKQPAPQYLRSPFLKISAVFGSWLIDIDVIDAATTRASAREPFFLAVGDRVRSADGATGVVASFARLEENKPPTAPSAGEDRAGDAPAHVRYQLVVTQADGEFTPHRELSREVRSGSSVTRRSLGTMTSVQRGRQWYREPCFFIHAGDQIYYDFPDPAREPNADQYRIAYREAWFEDEPLRYVLAHWPHYMTLDDHEIADQFARDFVSPHEQFPGGDTESSTADDYLREAMVAYREYVHALSPTSQKPEETGPLWYTFTKGRAHFFVLDTRTQRFNKRGSAARQPQIIDDAQMNALKQWMGGCARTELKFVVTSVPFVAEINEPASNARGDWYEHERIGRANRGKRWRNSEQDKWSASQFRAQREEIIDYIADQDIGHLVFLTGDMHCCYHATMRVEKKQARKDLIPKDSAKYESTLVHELAGGPVNQLQLARVDEFHQRCSKATAAGNHYEVRLEQFHGDVSAVVHISVEYPEREQVTATGRTPQPEVVWNVIRTLTDPGPTEWRVDPPTSPKTSKDAEPAVPATSAPGATIATRPGESIMGGRICFVQKRSVDVLARW
jgi:phosphodiesterase/alkaline phosphatase D-like protein